MQQIMLKALNEGFTSGYISVYCIKVIEASNPAMRDLIYLSVLELQRLSLCKLSAS